ncbi:MAG: CapA family protein [Clostridia bacterium]|nr:CapA family protein [Clostridia bacterium]
MKTGQIVVLVILFSILLGLLAIVVISPMLTDRFEDEVATVSDRLQTVSEEPAYIEEPSAVMPAEPDEGEEPPEEDTESEEVPKEEPLPETQGEQGEDGVVTLGAIGDIMIMPKQLSAAFNPNNNAYDFSKSFTAVKGMFSSVDLMCGNYEGTMAGAKYPYSNGKTDSEGRIKFNAPDSLALDLKNAGFDVITTANNHAGDYGAEGIANTLDTIRAAGMLQTGTYKESSDRFVPVIAERNGIKVGILSATGVINGNSGLSSSDRRKLFSRLQDLDDIQGQIDAYREAGADFIVMFAHWGKEYDSRAAKSSTSYAKRLLSMGVDLIIGAHPHVVQPFEKITVKRDGTSYTGLVAYSVGNFIANMSGDSQYGMYLQIMLKRNEEGIVVLDKAEYMPLLCFSKDIRVPIEGAEPELNENGEMEIPALTVTLHEVVPALSKPSLIKPYSTLDGREIKLIENARSHVIGVCGEDIVPVMEDSCWIS